MKDGDEWVVNGQKVWNSYAHKAQIGQLMARTDPDVPKHQGLTMFLLPMDTPGVEVRPLRQMTGDAEFNEVFLTDVRVPDANRVGEPGSGWRAVLTTLMSERASVGSGAASKAVDPVRMLTELAPTSAAPTTRSCASSWPRCTPSTSSSARSPSVAMTCGPPPAPSGAPRARS